MNQPTRSSASFPPPASVPTPRRSPGLPPKQGLYDPFFEHEACGVGFVVDMHGRKSHKIVADALQVLRNLDHRGASGAEINTGDGAGILIQMPHKFLAEAAKTARISLPEAGQYGCGLVFLPRNATVRRRIEERFEQLVQSEGLTLLGWRTRDLELGYLPFLRGKGIAQYVSDPVFMASLADPAPSPAGAAKRTVNLHTLGAFAALTRAHPGSFWKNLRSRAPLAAVQQFIATYSRPSLTWADLPFLRERTKLPVLLKGILHPDDARRALDHGMDGIVVSNHGGRQVDGAIATLDALPGVVRAVEGRVPVLMDGGIRGGADVFKALALGARAVCVGRPYVYALALAGRAGVLELFRNLAADFELTMGLAGCAAVAEIDPHALAEGG